MKKFLLSLLAIITVGVLAKAETITDSFSVQGAHGAPTTSTTTITKGASSSVQYEYYNVKSNSGYLFFDKTGGYITATLDYVVTAISVKTSSGQSTSTDNKLALYVNDEKIKEIELTKKSTVFTYEIPVEYQASGTKYKLLRTGSKNPQIVEIQYTCVTVNAPSFSPAGGSLTEGATITISADEGATISYKWGEETEEWKEYTTPVVVENGTLCAKATKNGADSSVAKATYEVVDPTFVAAPIFTPSDIEIKVDTPISLTCGTDGAVIKYSIDGAAEQEYDGEFTLAAGEHMVDAKAYNGEYVSELARQVYNVTRYAPALSWSTEAATAYFGMDFTAPTLTNELNAPVTYTSSNPSIATIDADGTITINTNNLAGTTTIKAAVAESDKFDADEVSYELTVAEAPETIEETINVENFTFTGTGYQDIEYTSEITGIRYEAYASKNDGIQISGKRDNGRYPGLYVSQNPNNYEIDAIIIGWKSNSGTTDRGFGIKGQETEMYEKTDLTGYTALKGTEICSDKQKGNTTYEYNKEKIEGNFRSIAIVADPADPVVIQTIKIVWRKPAQPAQPYSVSAEVSAPTVENAEIEAEAADALGTKTTVNKISLDVVVSDDNSPRAESYDITVNDMTTTFTPSDNTASIFEVKLVELPYAADGYNVTVTPNVEGSEVTPWTTGENPVVFEEGKFADATIIDGDYDVVMTDHAAPTGHVFFQPIVMYMIEAGNEAAYISYTTDESRHEVMYAGNQTFDNINDPIYSSYMMTESVDWERLNSNGDFNLIFPEYMCQDVKGDKGYTFEADRDIVVTISVNYPVVSSKTLSATEVVEDNASYAIRAARVVSAESHEANNVLAGSETITTKLNADKPIVTGIESVAADADAAVVYYNLQGIRIAHPEAGQVVVRRQGSSVDKVVVR